MKKNKKESFGQRIRALRKKKGMSIEDLALETGYPMGLIEQVEKDECVPPVSLVLQLSQTFKVDVEDNISEEEQRASKKRTRSHKKRLDAYAYTPLTRPGMDKHLRAFMLLYC
ncbi:MAG: helix-turn-helix transcriptional regulator [Thermodesulfobacteriota bacterium]|nr:helix-turn-helix transcriptional regulator [Thermodesulfobacteriota bacterium]